MISELSGHLRPTMATSNKPSRKSAAKPRPMNYEQPTEAERELALNNSSFKALVTETQVYRLDDSLTWNYQSTKGYTYCCLCDHRTSYGDRHPLCFRDMMARGYALCSGDSPCNSCTAMSGEGTLKQWNQIIRRKGDNWYKQFKLAKYRTTAPDKYKYQRDPCAQVISRGLQNRKTTGVRLVAKARLPDLPPTHQQKIPKRPSSPYLVGKAFYLQQLRGRTTARFSANSSASSSRSSSKSRTRNTALALKRRAVDTINMAKKPKTSKGTFKNHTFAIRLVEL